MRLRGDNNTYKLPTDLPSYPSTPMRVDYGSRSLEASSGPGRALLDAAPSFPALLPLSPQAAPVLLQGTTDSPPGE